MGARAGISLTKRDFQITNEKREGEGGFLDYKRDFRFTIHLTCASNYSIDKTTLITKRLFRYIIAYYVEKTLFFIKKVKLN